MLKSQDFSQESLLSVFIRCSSNTQLMGPWCSPGIADAPLKAHFSPMQRGPHAALACSVNSNEKKAYNVVIKKSFRLV